MAIKYYPDLIQGSDEWHAARCGLLTASEVKLILTPTLKPANNDKTRAHVYELAAQRITNFVEASYISDDMLRGYDDEILARKLYAENYAPVADMGFITNDKWGFTLGCSPDGLVGDDGVLECKSRRQKFQVETIAESILGLVAPEEYMLQIQTILLVSERKWVDFISYSGGLPMATIRVGPYEKYQAAIIEAAARTEERISGVVAKYKAALASKMRLIPTERRVEQEMYIS